MGSIQRPAATNTYLASPQDALLVLEAVRLERLPRTTRRLTRSERDALVEDGTVFVWEEQETQMQRWTDGKRWSCSRVMGEFLGYEQVLPNEILPGVRMSSRASRLEGGLIKQTYSATLLSEAETSANKYPPGDRVGFPRAFELKKADPADHAALIAFPLPSSPAMLDIISYHRAHSVEGFHRPSHQPFYADLELSRWRTTASQGRGQSPPANDGSSSSQSRRHRSDTIRPPQSASSATGRDSRSVSGGSDSDSRPASAFNYQQQRQQQHLQQQQPLQPSHHHQPPLQHYQYASRGPAPAPAPYAPTDRPLQAGPFAFPPPSGLGDGGSDPRTSSALPEYPGDPYRYHPYRPPYGSAPPSLKAGSYPPRRVISPTPSLISNATTDSSRCSSPKTASSYSSAGPGSRHGSGGGGSGRLWPTPRPSPIGGRDARYAPASIPVVDLLLPSAAMPTTTSPVEIKPPTALEDRPPTGHARGYLWQTGAPVQDRSRVRLTLDPEDERMLSRLQFRI